MNVTAEGTEDPAAPPTEARSTKLHSRFESLRRSPFGEQVTDLGKSALRQVGVATAGHRPPPELLVIGAKRGGTTSLWRYLDEHPATLPTFPRAQKIKGTYHFDEGSARGDRWYLSHFPTTARRRLVERRIGCAPIAFEASPYYLFHPLAPARAKATAPDALIVALLRDPVERAYSHWKERRNHTEDLPFEEAIDAEDQRTRGEEDRLRRGEVLTSHAHRHQTYVAQGCYAPMLERWFEAFGRERVIVAASEDFYADPQSFCDSLTDRLGIFRHTLTTTEPFNSEPSEGMTPGVRARLTELMEPHIAEVEDLLGRTMPWH